MTTVYTMLPGSKSAELMRKEYMTEVETLLAGSMATIIMMDPGIRLAGSMEIICIAVPGNRSEGWMGIICMMDQGIGLAVLMGLGGCRLLSTFTISTETKKPPFWGQLRIVKGRYIEVYSNSASAGKNGANELKS